MSVKRIIRVGSYFIEVRGNGRIELRDTPASEPDPMPAVGAAMDERTPAPDQDEVGKGYTHV